MKQAWIRFIKTKLVRYQDVVSNKLIRESNLIEIQQIVAAFENLENNQYAFSLQNYKIERQIKNVHYANGEIKMLQYLNS